MNELLLIGTAATDHLARKNQPGPPASHGRRIEMGRLVFVYRAALVGFAAFAAALIGFGLQELLPAAYLAASKSMITSIVGIDRFPLVDRARAPGLDEPRSVHQPADAAPGDCGRRPPAR